MSDEILEHAGILSSNEVSEEMLLGHLVGIVHHNFTMQQDVLNRIMDKAGLPDEYRPNKPRAVPSFQAACRILEHRKFEEITFRDPQTNADIKFKVEYMVDILNDGSRQLTRKILYPESAETSSEMEKLLNIYVKSTQKEPEKMAKFSYDAPTDSITRINLYDDPDELDIGEMTDKKYAALIERFNEIRNCYTERYLKDAWFRMLRAEGAIPWLKNCGSLWFIPRDARKYVEAFGKIYLKIHGEHGTWRTVPIINTEEQRKCLKQDVNEEYKERFKTFLINVAKRMESSTDEDALKSQLRESKSNFENQLNNELFKRYNSLLNMSIKAKIDDFKGEFESSRLEKAREMLANL